MTPAPAGPERSIRNAVERKNSGQWTVISGLGISCWFGNWNSRTNYVASDGRM